MQDDARLRVAANVRAELARAGKNQSDLARALGVRRQSISQRLLGRAAIKAEEITRIAAWLGVPVDVLLDTRERVAA